MFYRIIDNKLYDYADFKYAEDCLETDIVTQKELDKHKNKCIIENGELILNPNYEKEEEDKEKERISMLSLTKREVFLALYKDKEITPEVLRARITSPEALIEFDYAEKYYRGNPLINQIGDMLGYTPKDLNYLFINGEFPPKPEPTEPTEPTEEPEPTEPTEPTEEPEGE